MGARTKEEGAYLGEPLSRGTLPRARDRAGAACHARGICPSVPGMTRPSGPPASTTVPKWKGQMSHF